MKFSTILLAPLFAASYVSAHGSPTQVDVDGGGSFPLDGGDKNAIRPVSDVGPNRGFDNQNLTCGPNAQKAPNLIDVQPGQNISVHWVKDKWPHNTGPIMNYMALCEGGCVNFDADGGTQWFKIPTQDGPLPEGTWPAQENLFLHHVPAKVTIPRELEEGEYLLRHEIISLHIAVQTDLENTIEFYPSCIQLRVGPGGSVIPTTNLLNFPGRYSDADFPKSPFGTQKDYEFPGGPIPPEFGGGSPAPPSTTKSRKPSSTPKPSNTGPGNVNAESPPSSLPSSVTTPKVCKTKSPKPSSTSLPPVNSKSDPANASNPTNASDPANASDATPTPTATDGYGRRRLGRIMRRRAENEMGLH